MTPDASDASLGGREQALEAALQEKVTVFRTEKRIDAHGKKYPWIVKSATPVQANRRLLHVQTIRQDCAVGEDVFRRLNEPVVVKGQRNLVSLSLQFSRPPAKRRLS